MFDEERTSERSFARLTDAHLARLSALAAEDHARLTRPGGRPEYRPRRLAVVLAQGAALHYLDGTTGVKDLDVWTFYATIPGTQFPADRRETHADFGRSAFGRARYDWAAARNDAERARWQRWDVYEGRRVDLMMRALPVEPEVATSTVIDAIQSWFRAGAHHHGARKPSAWHLARKAAVLIDPERERGRVLWPAGQ